MRIIDLGHLLSRNWDTQKQNSDLAYNINGNICHVAVALCSEKENDRLGQKIFLEICVAISHSRLMLSSIHNS